MNCVHCRATPGAVLVLRCVLSICTHTRARFIWVIQFNSEMWQDSSMSSLKGFILHVTINTITYRIKCNAKWIFHFNYRFEGLFHWCYLVWKTLPSRQVIHEKIIVWVSLRSYFHQQIRIFHLILFFTHFKIDWNQLRIYFFIFYEMHFSTEKVSRYGFFSPLTVEQLKLYTTDVIAIIR